jgi:hypothetical protein
MDGYELVHLPCGDYPLPYEARRSVSKALLVANPSAAAGKLGVSPEKLGTVAAEQGFTEANLDSDGRLSMEEFCHQRIRIANVGPSVCDHLSFVRSHSW